MNCRYRKQNQFTRPTRQASCEEIKILNCITTTTVQDDWRQQVLYLYLGESFTGYLGNYFEMVIKSKIIQQLDVQYATESE